LLWKFPDDPLPLIQTFTPGFALVPLSTHFRPHSLLNTYMTCTEQTTHWHLFHLVNLLRLKLTQTPKWVWLNPLQTSQLVQGLAPMITNSHLMA
jgi:hypothetical protein